MQIPLEVRYGEDVERTSRIDSVISERAQKLDHFCDHIISCRVAVERPHHAASSGNPHRVRIDVTVPPGHELVVDKGPPNVPFDESLETTIIESFKAMERQLKELSDRQQGEVKSHQRTAGIVVRLFRERGYGFLKEAEGDQEVYFQRSAVPNGDFDRLEIGTQVRYVPRMGEKGPQASTVKIIDKPGHRVSPDEPVPVPPGWQKN
jgi:cold shock CspA family protein